MMINSHWKKNQTFKPWTVRNKKKSIKDNPCTTNDQQNFLNIILDKIFRILR